MTSATQEPEKMTAAAAPPVGNLEITVSSAELLRELTEAQSVVGAPGGARVPVSFEATAGDDY